MTSRPHISLDRTLLFFAVLLFSLPIVAAEQLAFADDYFHGGAMRYLSNNIPGALDIVTNGRLKFPDDEKLKKLEELLKQQNQQNDQQKSEEKKQKDQKKDESKQSKKDDQKKDQDNKDQQKSDEQKEKEKQDQQAKPGDKKNSEEPQSTAAAPKNEQMTPEQAMRVLDTTKGDEKILPLQSQKPPPSDKKLKDW